MILLACSNMLGQELKIVIFSVNSADATLIIFPTGKTMMVDSGTEDMNIARVMPFLYRHGINHLDYYVDTHGHKDHYGGRAPMTEAGIIDENTKTWNEFTNDGSPAKYPQVYYNSTEEGPKELLYGSEFEMEGTHWFISNREDIDFFGTTNANINSLAFRMEYNGFIYSHGGDEARLSMDRFLADHPDLVEAHVRNTAHHMRGPVRQNYLEATNAELYVISNMPGMSANKTYYNLLLETIDDLEGNGRDHEAVITGDVGHIAIRTTGADDWSYETCLNYNSCIFDVIKKDDSTWEPEVRTGYFDHADDLLGWNTAGPNTLSLNTTDHQEGEACLQMTGQSGQEFYKTFSSLFDAEGTVENTILKFSYYVSDVSLIKNNIHIEISSSGSADMGEYNWVVNKNDLVDGWNDIELRVSDAGISLGATPIDPDLSIINWFRLFGEKTGVITTRIDGIQLYNEDGKSNEEDTHHPNDDHNEEPVLSIHSCSDHEIKIYPNPSKDFIALLNQNESKKYYLYNRKGQVVQKGILNVNERENVQNLSPGFYIISFEDGTNLNFIKE